MGIALIRQILQDVPPKFKLSDDNFNNLARSLKKIHHTRQPIKSVPNSLRFYVGSWLESEEAKNILKQNPIEKCMDFYVKSKSKREKRLTELYIYVMSQTSHSLGSINYVEHFFGKTIDELWSHIEKYYKHNYTLSKGSANRDAPRFIAEGLVLFVKRYVMICLAQCFARIDIVQTNKFNNISEIRTLERREDWKIIDIINAKQTSKYPDLHILYQSKNMSNASISHKLISAYANVRTVFIDNSVSFVPLETNDQNETIKTKNTSQEKQEIVIIDV
jgi:hypothetical protein